MILFTKVSNLTVLTELQLVFGTGSCWSHSRARGPHSLDGKKQLNRAILRWCNWASRKSTSCAPFLKTLFQNGKFWRKNLDANGTLNMETSHGNLATVAVQMWGSGPSSKRRVCQVFHDWVFFGHGSMPVAQGRCDLAVKLRISDPHGRQAYLWNHLVHTGKYRLQFCLLLNKSHYSLHMPLLLSGCTHLTVHGFDRMHLGSSWKPIFQTFPISSRTSTTCSGATVDHSLEQFPLWRLCSFYKVLTGFEFDSEMHEPFSVLLDCQYCDMFLPHHWTGAHQQVLRPAPQLVFSSQHILHLSAWPSWMLFIEKCWCWKSPRLLVVNLLNDGGLVQRLCPGLLQPSEASLIQLVGLMLDLLPELRLLSTWREAL